MYCVELKGTVSQYMSLDLALDFCLENLDARPRLFPFEKQRSEFPFVSNTVCFKLAKIAQTKGYYKLDSEGYLASLSEGECRHFHDAFALVCAEFNSESGPLIEQLRVGKVADYQFEELKNQGKLAALFLDRDGILIEDSGYPSDPDKLIFCDSVLPVLKQAQQSGYELYVVTNQSGVARGLFGVEVVERINAAISTYYQSHGIHFTDWAYCPFHPEGQVAQYALRSHFRKPQPGMILKLVERYQINLKKSVMIGDRPTDRFRGLELNSYILKEFGDYDQKKREYRDFKAMLKDLPF